MLIAKSMMVQKALAYDEKSECGDRAIKVVGKVVEDFLLGDYDRLV